MFSQWKNLVWKQNPKTEEELFNYINRFQNIVTADHSKHYVDHVYHNAIDCLEDSNVCNT